MSLILPWPKRKTNYSSDVFDNERCGAVAAVDFDSQVNEWATVQLIFPVLGFKYNIWIQNKKKSDTCYQIPQKKFIFLKIIYLFV